MPKGPQGQKRPADANACAVMVGRIATGEIEEQPKSRTKAKGGRAGGAARAKALGPQKRREIGQKAAAARWGKKPQ